MILRVFLFSRIFFIKAFGCYPSSVFSLAAPEEYSNSSGTRVAADGRADVIDNDLTLGAGDLFHDQVSDFLSIVETA